MDGVHSATDARDDHLAPQQLHPPAGIPGLVDEPLDWCATFLNDLEADAGASASASRPKHRRTYSAPPALKQIELPPATGKRPDRSPRLAPADPSTGLVTGIDPLHDIRSPAYKKQVSTEDVHIDAMEVSDSTSAASKERAAPAHYGHSRSASFDAAIFHRRGGDSARGGMFGMMAAAPAAGASGPGGGYKCRRCGDEKRNHVCNAADASLGDAPSSGARDSKTIPWTSAEDKVICEGVELHGFKWSLISLSLPGRTDNAVRNRWHRLEQARRWREEVQAQYQAAQADGSAPAQMPGSAYPGYKCRRCGQPKRGHVCPYEDTTQLPAPRPLPPPQPPRSSKERSARAQAQQAQQKQQGQPAPSAHGAQHTAAGGGAPHSHRGYQQAGHHVGEEPHLHRPSSAPSIAVVPPAAGFDARTSGGMGVPHAAPSPGMRALGLDMPLSAHVRALESGMDHDAITVGDLEDLIFGSLPLDLTDMPSHSPLKTMALVGSPLRFTRMAPPAPLPTIPSGEAIAEHAPAGVAVPNLERQSTPQAIHAN